MRTARHVGALIGGALMTLLLSAALANADTADADPLIALMMGGTGMPTPSEFWRDTIISDYINPTTGQDYTSVLVPTPESAASTSIPVGLANLQAMMDDQPADVPYLVQGYSQSAQIAVLEKLLLMQQDPDTRPDVTFLLLGSGNRPDGGFLERFAGLVIPGAPGFDFNGAEPTTAGIDTIDIANQYDAVADFPRYPVNLVADANALLGFFYSHAGYGNGPLPYEVPAIWPPSDPISGPYADEYVLGSSEIVKQIEGDTTFYFIPTTNLPLLEPLRTLGVPEPVLKIFQPALQVIVEAGYDRSTPFGDPTPAELFPTLDPVTFSLQFANGVVQGANNGFALFGAELPGFDQLETFFAEAEAWSEQTIGVPYYDFVTDLNADFNPFTAFIDIEGPIGASIQNLLDLSGIQQNLLDPVLGLVGSVGGMFTS
ncbi:PE-PPE domain-containing protein [Candidatus Mycobacterium wuenschmannii]|uniref:PE-PPE domain-containing protein n=1 Tax=Candidatus Mycobacterium wuenschmannii TaxID=3027808 RepID=A0ABY8VWE4_9MYCO|nr:PE-PPE domain-containing protein [Candidatus Mycobacterium wuenschmannii]WIM86497.1 PE-PPE domain-containing protein [Candidatus Mycobacterium wuenschmannii]